MPTRGVTAVERMVRWKTQPHHLQPSRAFSDLIAELRCRLADLVGAQVKDVVLANSASYGLHLLANGMGLEAGDEVVVAANDFPSDLLPWLRLQQHGVIVRQIRPTKPVATADEVRSAITHRTRAVCLTWVHSFSGQMIDLEGIGSLCREAGVLFIVNGSQAVGAIPLDVKQIPIDALSTVGFKWLCGPYGTGFCWLGERAQEKVAPTKLYWLNTLSTDDLTKPDIDLSDIDPPETGRHDIFGTANFFNNAPFAESVDLINSTGVPAIHDHNLELAAQLIAGLDHNRFEVQDRGPSKQRSGIIFVRPLDASADRTSARLAAGGIDVAQRSGMIRLAPHFYNTVAEVGHVLEVMNAG
ncbi:MAG: aminotransferase class V-fold PLP-dependent enzyme [Actinomycetia bacterium]|nr:aminotransferase class V-fold PLP-dependent enzyme [Actinomycetes bacterium]